MQLIKHIKASNILSFGPDGLDLPLGSLNVLIGPNGSGKSNFLELLELLRVIPSENVQKPILDGGGIDEWIWKGADAHSQGLIEAILDYSAGLKPLRHVLKFGNYQERFYISDERISDAGAIGGGDGVYAYYQMGTGMPIINFKDDTGKRLSTSQGIQTGISVLSQLQDPRVYPELFYVAMSYKRIKLYREWSFGRNSIYRKSQPTNHQSDSLESDFSNLGLFLSRLRKKPAVKNALIVALKDLYQGLTDFEVTVGGGTVQVFFFEGDFTIPATRLSDGTLRYFCLLAILLDPTPPPLICIEEPELGLHPDILPKIADLLIAASERTQLVVTTHSDILIDALSEQPDSVLVCEKHEGQTSIRRLDENELKPWLEQYRLGQLWSMGEIGGNRW
ncbi:MAG: AAA family ATPase [Phycisphaerae bacterium]|nr:AAA family ATPase [Saprospiraceae bacterium]